MLAKSHGITVPRSCVEALRAGTNYQIVRHHLLHAIGQERGRARAFVPLLQFVPSLSVPTGAPEDTLTIHDVTDFPSLFRFAQQKQQPSLPSNLRQVIRYLHGGVSITKKKLITWAKELGVRVHMEIYTATRVVSRR